MSDLILDVFAIDRDYPDCDDADFDEATERLAGGSLADLGPDPMDAEYDDVPF
jgi:hypothetical protein